MKFSRAEKDENGNIVKLYCTIDEQSRGGNAPDGRKIKGTIHYVSKSHALKAKAVLFDKLFTKEDMTEIEEGKDFKDYLNPESKVEREILIEPALKEAKPGEPLQFERNAYFTRDTKEPEGQIVFNRSVTLKDSFPKA